MPKVSVLLSSYNHAAFLRESIDSILNQTFSDFELIIVDDASSDDSWQIIQSYHDPRIKAVRAEQNTSARLYESFFHTVKSPYLAVAHSDDAWAAEKLQKQVDYLEAHPEMAACFTLVRVIDEENRTLSFGEHAFAGLFDKENRSRTEWLSFFFREGNCLCHPSVLIRSTAYADYNLSPRGLTSLPDFYIWVRLAMHASFFILQEPLTIMRAHGDENTSAATKENGYRLQIECYQAIFPLFRQLSEEDFLAVFPEAMAYVKQEGFLQDFAYAQILLSDGRKFAQLYGYDLLEDLFKSPETEKALQALYGYGLSDFGRQKKENEIFGQPPLVTSVYYDIGGGFNEQDKLEKKISYNSLFTEITFDLSLIQKPLLAVRIDLDEGSYLKCTGFHIELDGDIFPYTTEHTTLAIDDTLLFKTTDPALFLKNIPASAAQLTISGIMERISESSLIDDFFKKNKEAEQSAFWMENQLRELNALYSAQRTQLDGARQHELQLEEALGQVTGSFFWRGSFPLRWFFSAVKKACRSIPGVRQAYGLLVCLKDNGWAYTAGYMKDRRYFLKRFPGRSIPADRFVPFETLKKQAQSELQGPVISLLTPLYNTPKEYLIEMIDSVRNQTYSNWELCLADAGIPPETKREIDKYLSKDPRIRYRKLEQNLGISNNTNAAMEMARGDYFAALDHDDLLHPAALYKIAEAILDGADFVYTDEVTFEGEIENTVLYNFKPDFSPDLLTSNNYICHLTTFSRKLEEEAGAYDSACDGSQDYDIILRLSEKAKKITHVPGALYYWRASPTSVAGGVEAKPYCITAAIKALYGHFERIGQKVEKVELLPGTAGFYKTTYPLLDKPLISILIPNKDEVAVLRNCLNSILKKTTYPNYEILVIENNSTSPATFRYYESLRETAPRVRVVPYKSAGPFNYSKLNNFAVKQALGSVFVLLNNDTKIITPMWLEEMLMYAQQPRIGCVGAMLYFPDDTVQHAGVGLGLGGVAGHFHRGFVRGHGGYVGRMLTVSDVSAVTAACLMVRKEVYEKVNGLDEEFAVAFNDVDFCMKVLSAGYQNLFTPFAELYHYESKSRGLDLYGEKSERFGQEVSLFKERWGEQLKKGDPFYNPNLTKITGDFALDIKPII